MTTGRRSEPTRRLSGDEGTVLIEFALVAPLLFSVLLAVLEFGMAWRIRSDVQSASRLALRIDANAGNNSLADWNTILAYQANLSRLSSVTVHYLIVFKGSPTLGATVSVPTACKTAAEALSPTSTTAAGVTDVCNIYTGKMIATTASSPAGAPSYSCTASRTPSSAWDGYWCPRTRATGMDANSGNGPDVIGLYAKYTYTTFTKLVGSSLTLTDQAVGRLEPR